MSGATTAFTESSLDDSMKALLVSSLISCFYWIFWVLELWIWVPYIVVQALQEARARAEGSKSSRREKPVVVIVGANFSGLAALRKLSETKGSKNLFEIVLIDQREYFEYTPGILRLFCQPDHVNNIAKKLPRGASASTHKFIHGKVDSVFAGEEEESATNGTVDKKSHQKLLTYCPVVTHPDGTTRLASSSRTLKYDYLILATGATYPAPIWPTTNEWTLKERRRGWNKVHKDLLKARRVIILGAGAVGVELAAEIADHYHHGSSRRKEITLVDAAPSVVPLFPPSAGTYAHQWLQRRGVQFRLGQKLTSWNDTSCTFPDGTVLEADIVYNCLGSKANSDILKEIAPGGGERDAHQHSKPTQGLVFTPNRNIAVQNTLQIVRGGPVQDGSIFACGDVASPPSSNEKQAFQAEIQGKVAAHNVLTLACSMSSSLSSSVSSARHSFSNKKLQRYPQDLMGNRASSSSPSPISLPLVVDLSLGRYDGVIAFNGLCIPGPLAAVVKWILEYTKVLQMQNRPLGMWIWKLGDALVIFLASTVLKSTRSSPLDKNKKQR